MSAIQEATKSPTSAFEDGPGYLKAKGWRCIGNPAWPTARYLDPTKPLATRTHMEPRFARAIDGKMKQVQAFTGKLNGEVAPVEQVVVEPAATPLSLEDALQIQMGRDEQELLAREGLRTPEAERALAENAAQKPRK